MTIALLGLTLGFGAIALTLYVAARIYITDRVAAWRDP